MAFSDRREVLVIYNAEGASRKYSVREWQEWGSELPIRTINIPPTRDLYASLCKDFTHAWFADANYAPFPNVYIGNTRQRLAEDARYSVFSVGKPMAYRGFYDQKLTTVEDKHDRFGGLRYIDLAYYYHKDNVWDDSWGGQPMHFVEYNASRLGFPYNVFMLYTNEGNADENERAAKAVYPYTSLVGVPIDSILNSHKHLADISDTEMFLVLDADFKLTKEILHQDFKEWETDSVHLWYARNPINGLVYGHGGPKAFNKSAFNSLSSETLDMTTNASNSRLVIHKQEVGVHAFNWSPLSSWRTAFREVAKLVWAQDTLPPDEAAEASHRMNVWLDKQSADSVPFAEDCLNGASEGFAWARTVNNRVDAVRINKFQWLEDRYKIATGEKD